MAEIKVNRTIIAWIFFLVLVMVCNVGIAERFLKDKGNQHVPRETVKTQGFLAGVVNFLWQSGKSGYEPVWPEMEFGWKVVVGTIVGFLGAALGSVGGVGGGGIFVPMLSLIIGFDPKSSTAISKCMIMGAAGSTVYYNLKLRHPTLEMPLIDYDLALLFQPMLMLGISIGVAFNVMFADWMVTVLLIILFIGTSTKAFFKGVDTWKKETVIKKEAAKSKSAGEYLVILIQQMDYAKLEIADGSARDYKPLPSGPGNQPDEEVPLLQNIYWKEVCLLVYVWIGFLIVQIIKEYIPTCSVMYWIVNSLQIPIAASVTLFEAVSLYKGTRVIASKGKEVVNWKIYQILLYCSCGIIAGMVGGLLGLGGGFILGPLFLELGIPPQVASATSTFAMVFSSSMSVVQYYLLNRFPVPYAAYFVLVATIAAFTGQHVVRKIIAVIGRTSIIIFILALTIFISAISLGGVGIAAMVEKLENGEYMGFENLCT
ncbi:hypothetical protein like AT2G25737 [Hibiscus trionum]|uniref:Sulfite exporter TauE/SafE family protein n=1 Tax=Hibiscus trionum TaxID=183268 RepID=A0A9W7J6S6_HIBTR|nr:hypothetical protein like AT2G25737 [Hibiscus trionum]